MEVLVMVVVAILVLAVAAGPLLAMRNPAEADKRTPGADPAGSSSKESDAQREHHRVANAQAHRGPVLGGATRGAGRQTPVAGLVGPGGLSIGEGGLRAAPIRRSAPVAPPAIPINRTPTAR